MNNKQTHLDRIVDVVVECCSTEIRGMRSLSREDVLGKSRAENVVMTRCILAMMIIGEGYSVTTVAMLLGRTAHAVRNLLETGHNYHLSSRAFRIASAEATLRCRDLNDSGI